MGSLSFLGDGRLKTKEQEQNDRRLLHVDIRQAVMRVGGDLKLAEKNHMFTILAMGISIAVASHQL